MEDATQEIFVRAWRHLGTYRKEAAFGTWLNRVAVNFLRDHGRKLRVESLRHGEAEAATGATVPTPGRALDSEAALMRLPEGARRIVVLHDVEGHTHQEIADMLEISVGTSKSQLHRGRVLMRAFLTGEENS